MHRDQAVTRHQPLNVAPLSGHKTHQIDDFSEVDFNATIIEVRIVGRVVNQLAELPLTHLGSPISKYKEEGINGIGLS